jgi:prophage maintenance system killer protein
VDGNKRTGLISALTFLSINGVELEKGDFDFEELVMKVAQGASGGKKIASLFRASRKSP